MMKTEVLPQRIVTVSKKGVFAAENSDRLGQFLVISFMLLTTFFCGAEPAHATLLDGFGDKILEVLNSNFLRSIATAAVIIMGILALSGRVSWAAFIIVLLGIVVVFGASAIVDYFADAAASASASIQFFSPAPETIGYVAPPTIG